ncbi:hypothetical protein J7L05_01235 [bacterium]|nr:hypothetical protein [bacterium]
MSQAIQAAISCLDFNIQQWIISRTRMHVVIMLVSFLTILGYSAVLMVICTTNSNVICICDLYMLDE